MNKDNYASLEAVKRLDEAGIVLETDCYWRISQFSDSKLIDYTPTPSEMEQYVGVTIIPAPSMAEVWRELPQRVDDPDDVYESHTFELTLEKWGYFTSASYDNYEGQSCKYIECENPIDALIDLLIWVKKEK